MTGFGWMGDNSTIGFIHQGLLVHDRAAKSKCLGWAGAYFFKREQQAKNDQSFRANNRIENKESYKWIGPSLPCRDQVLKEARHQLYIMDREADIFEVMSLLPKSNSCDVLLRMQQNRRLKTLNGDAVKLYEDLERQQAKGTVKLVIQGDNRKRRKRIAHMEVKFRSYWLKRSSHILNKEDHPSRIQMQAIQIREKPSSVPDGEQAISWRLWTSETVDNLAEALELIECYRARWYIEEAFRLLKTEGFSIESTELESGKSIRKLLLIAMEASVKIMNLKAARDGNSTEKIGDFFTEEEIKFIHHLSEQLQGDSEKLKNPHPKEILSFASWVIARLGGWKGYLSQRPPGTITFKVGLERFEMAFFGYSAGNYL